MTWRPTSLIRVLVDQTLQRCQEVSLKAQQRRVVLEMVFQSSYYTLEERVALTNISRDIAKQWPECVLINKQRVLLKRLVWAQCVEEVMQHAGMATSIKWFLRGLAVQRIENMKAEKMLQAPYPSMMTTDRSCLAFAFFLSVAALGLDYDAERAFCGLIQGQASKHDEWLRIMKWTTLFLNS